jgi:hypothetical protein
MLLCSGKNGLWAFDDDMRVFQVVAQGSKFGLTRLRSPRPLDQLPPESGLELEWDEHKSQLLENGHDQPAGPLVFGARDSASTLMVGPLVFILGDTRNEVFDLRTRTSTALPGRDVGSDVLLAVSGVRLVVAAPEGQVNILDLGTLQWVGHRSLNLDTDHCVQALAAHDGEAYFKLPLQIVVVDLSSLDVLTWPAPWVHEPQLAWGELAPGLELQAVDLPRVNLVPSYVDDQDAFAEFRRTGRTASPASVASRCVDRGDSETLSELLLHHDFDCLVSRVRHARGGLLHSPMHALLSKGSPAVARVVRLHAEIRDAPLLYSPPAYGDFKFVLDGLTRIQARKWIRDVLRRVFVNVDELI